MMEIKTQTDSWVELSGIFNTCENVTHAENVTAIYELLNNGFAYMAMTDYPYPSDFLQPQPAWPVNASCKFFENVTVPTGDEKFVGVMNDTVKEILAAVKKASDVYFNNSG